uniref:HAD-superfamily hydrolase, subfamily IA, variant 3 n=1 Tax=Cyanothece sp. (strain PCC 7425 / ATCC 29141) TaxID=395961 RepID=B8HRB9_CYAP4
MSLKAVLFDFNGVILDDEPLHKQLIEEILINENLRPRAGEFEQFCLGRSDRAGLKDLLTQRGRWLTETHLDRLIATKTAAYQQYLKQLETLPLFEGLQPLLEQLQKAEIKMAVVTGAQRSEVMKILERTQLSAYFSVLVTAEDCQASKPEPEGYLLAVQLLAEKFPQLQLTPLNCLAIEDSFAGIEAAKRAGIPVLGVAHTYPFHMLQRRANWTVDYLQDLELDRLIQTYGGSPA